MTYRRGTITLSRRPSGGSPGRLASGAHSASLGDGEAAGRGPAARGRQLRSPGSPRRQCTSVARRVHLHDRVPPDVARRAPCATSSRGRRRRVPTRRRGSAAPSRSWLSCCSTFVSAVPGRLRRRRRVLRPVRLPHHPLVAPGAGVDRHAVAAGVLGTSGPPVAPGVRVRAGRHGGGLRWLSPLAQRTLATDAMAAGVFVVNFVFADRFGDYFAYSQVQPSPLLHFWSLAVEEQFYLVWPVVLVLTRVGRVSTAGWYSPPSWRSRWRR